MALRTSKITSEIIQTCSKYFSSNAENFPKTLSNELTYIKPQQRFRYKIANTEKPQDLPELNFHDEGATLFAELQPSANPEFRFDAPPKWAGKVRDNSPFPPSIEVKSRNVVTYSDQQKAEDKLVKCKMISFNPTSRHFSTSSASFASRSPADNHSKGNCKQKIDPCIKIKKRKDCKIGVNKKCPSFQLTDCKQAKGSHCELRYLDRHCVKKQAPYPSYSEACAEHLPDDPSECQQCPWRTCDSADTIYPGKPVRHRRHYSTCCNRHLEVTNGVVTGPTLLPPLCTIQEHLATGKCGNTKTPCKEPPGPCEVRKQKEEMKKKGKVKRHEETKKKKAADLDDRMILRNIKEAGRDMILIPYAGEPVRIYLEDPNVSNPMIWTSMNKNMEVSLNGKKHPYCHKDKKPKRPKPNQKSSDDTVIEYGEIDWWSGRGKKTVVTDPADPNARSCKIEQYRPRQEIRSKQEVTKKTWKKKDNIEDKVNDRPDRFNKNRCD